MRDDEIDFESIQRIFAQRDAEKKDKKEGLGVLGILNF